MSEEVLTVSQIYARGKENLEKMGVDRWFAPDSNLAASVQANRKYLDSLFFEPQFLKTVEVNTSLTIFNRTLEVPVFCSAISRASWMPRTALTDIAQGVSRAGSLMMLGIGGSDELQSAIDTGAPVVKIVKPYRNTDLIYEKARDAEGRGCVAIGMDIDHFYGALVGDGVSRTEVFGPKLTSELKQLISQSKLPFIIKGVLSVQDAQQAAQLGASAIVVSNHGRGSFDFMVPSMIALPKIVESVGDKVTVLIDTGFKTGNDVLKALAFGAKAVGFASSMLLALAADGSRGVESLINQIGAELRRTMAATGCSTLSDVNRSMIIQAPYMA